MFDLVQAENVEVQSFRNELFEIEAIKDENGSIYFNLEKVSICLGFTKTEVKNGKKYTSIRWERVNKYLNEIDSIDHKWEKEDFIPESLVYMLAFKAESKAAVNFQMWLANEVIPGIRKTGGYVADEKFFVESYFPEADETTRNFMIQTLKDKKKLLTENKELKKTVDGVIHNKKYHISPTIIANKFGMTAQRFNKVLESLGVQYQKGKAWILTKNYKGLGDYSMFQKPTGEWTYGKSLKFRNEGLIELVKLLENNGFDPVERYDDLFR